MYDDVTNYLGLKTGRPVLERTRNPIMNPCYACTVTDACQVMDACKVTDACKDAAPRNPIADPCYACKTNCLRVSGVLARAPLRKVHHGLLRSGAEARVAEPGTDKDARPALSALAMHSDNIVLGLVDKALSSVDKLDERVEQGRIVVLYQNVLNTTPKEVGVVVALCTQVEDEKLLSVVSVEKPHHVVHGIAEVGLRAQRWQGHGDGRRYDVGQVEVKAIFLVAASVEAYPLAQTARELDDAQEADDA